MDLYWLSVLFVSVLWMHEDVLCGHEEVFETDGKMKLILANDYGIPISGQRRVSMEIKGCGNAYFILTKTSKFADTSGQYYVFMLGTGNNGKINGIKESCFSCKQFKATKYSQLLDCNRFRPFWVTWNDNGNVKLGSGMHINGRPLLDYTGTDKFDINYLNLLSSKFKVEWKISSDIPPVFVYPSPFGNTVIKIPENTKIGTELLKVNATDIEGDEITYSVVGDYDQIFQCNESCILLKNLDFETQSYYLVQIQAYDGFNFVKVAITVEVTDVNDESPVLEIAQGMSISEELPAGTSIGGLIIASDRDQNDSLIFRLEGNDSKYFFNITSEGNIIINDRLDRDGSNGRVMLYNLSITVIDAANHEMNTTVNITVNDVNDNAPQFEHSFYRINITENLETNLTILKLACSDADVGVNANFTITLTDTLNGTFSLKGDQLFVDGEKVDLESMDESLMILSVVAVDTPDHGRALTGSAQILVKVLPRNDFDPTWRFPNTDEKDSFPNISIAQSTPPNVVIATFKADDKDVGVRNNITYSILSATSDLGTDSSSKFSIDPTTGVLKLDSSIKLNETVFDITVQASDGDEDARTVTGKLKLLVQRTNQHRPMFNQSLYEVQLKEDSPAGTVIHTALADDADLDDVVYQVMGEWNTTFQTDGSQVKLVKKLDYEDRRSYPITIRASDGEKETSCTLLVTVEDVIDEPPLIQVSDTLTMPSNIPVNTILGGVFRVSDGDEGDQLTYNLTGNDSLFFELHPTNGQLKVVKLFNSDGVTKHLDSLMLEVRDKAGTTATKALNITLLEPAEGSGSGPMLLRTDGYRVEVFENTSVGSALYNMTLEVDVGDPAAAVYKVIGPGNETFSFSGSILTLVRSVDFETQPVYILTINVTAGKTSMSGSIVVQVNDVNDEFPIITLEKNIQIAEEIPVRTRIAGLFHVVDNDKGDNLTYSLTGNHSKYFSIDPANGQLQIQERIDRDGTTGVRLLEEITLNVVDSAGHKTNATFNVKITGINDNPPFCGSTVHKANVTENSTNDLVVTSLSCTDLDDESTRTISLSIVNGNEGSVFKVNGTDIVANGESIDYDSPSTDAHSYWLTVLAVDQVQDGHSNTASVLVHVQVVSKNEFSPVWTSDSSENGTLKNQTVASNIERDSSIITLNASDLDAGPDGEITYHLMSTLSDKGTDISDLFHIDQTTGQLTNIDFLDSRSSHNISEYYDITVMANDMGQLPRNVTGTVRLSVQPVEWKSVFNTSTTTVVKADIPEDKNIGDIVHTFEHINPVIYELVVTGMSKNIFECNRNKLILKNKLDYETQTVHVVTTRVFNAITTSHVTVVVKVTDVIDEFPVIELSPQLNLVEELPVGSIVAGLFTVKDSDRNDTFNYTLSGQHAKYFNINPSTGELTVRIPVDRDGDEGLAVLDVLWLTVTDTAGLKANTSLNISVLDINDNEPVCTSGIIHLNITENSTPGLDVLNLTCYDADYGQDANITLHLASHSLTSSFSIQESTLVTSDSFDYDNPGTLGNAFTILVLATDHPISGQSNTGTTVVQVEILSKNEFEPIWQMPNQQNGDDSSSSTSSQAESTTLATTTSSTNTSLNATNTTLNESEETLPGLTAFPAVSVDHAAEKGAIVSRVEAKDQDEGRDGQLLYEIISVVSDSNQSKSDIFMIESDMGIITLNVDLTDNDKVSKYYDLVVSAKDNGNPSKSTRAQLRVNVRQPLNNPPLFNESLSDISLPEDTAVGEVVYNVSVWDVDGDNVTVHVKGNATEFFLVNETKLILLKKMDFEKEEFHLCILSATDGTSTTETSLLVRVTNVMDESPVIQIGEQTTLSEELPLGVIIGGLFTITDADEHDTLNYTLHGSHSTFLHIDHVTGDVSIRDYVDYDGRNGLHYLDDLMLIVEDSARMTANVTLNLTVLDANDNSPMFSESIYYANVTEDGKASLSVLELLCTDDDGGLNGNVTLKITNGDTDSVFHLEGFELLVDASRVDYDSINQTQPEYVLTILATDSPVNGTSNVATTVVIVKVLPKNEFAPEWQTANVSESETKGKNTTRNLEMLTIKADVDTGTPVTVFKATDKDRGEDGRVDYYILSITSEKGLNQSNAFKLDRSTGVLATAKTFSDRVRETFNLTIQAQDNGSPRKHINTTVSVTLEPVANTPPQFLLSVMSVTVPEDMLTGTVLFNISVTDPEGDNVTLDLLRNGTQHFVIEGHQLKLNGKLDFEKNTVHVITIRASDGETNSSAVAQINIDDVIDEYPMLQASGAIIIPEELLVGTRIGRLASVVDNDKGDNLTLYLYGRGSEFFTISPHCGEVSINKTMDYDKDVPFHNGALTLQAVDSAGLQSNISINISITNVNDNPPVFQHSVFSVSVQENTTRDSVLVRLNITDDDQDDNITVAIAQGNDAGYFRLVHRDLYVQGEALNYEQKATFTLLITAEDQPTSGHSLTGTTVITVQVTSKNEFAPVWTTLKTSSEYSTTFDTKLNTNGTVTNTNITVVDGVNRTSANTTMIPNNTLAEQAVFPNVNISDTVRPGTVIGVYQAEDADAGADGIVSYSIISVDTESNTNTTHPFSYDENTGIFTVTKQIKMQSPNDPFTIYDVKIAATDGGTPKRRTEAMLRVTVEHIAEDLNFNQSVYRLSVLENTTVGEVMYSLSFRSDNINLNNVSFEIVDANQTLSHQFQMDRNNVLLSKELDFEDRSQHLISVRATYGSSEANAWLMLDVGDVIDEMPEIRLSEQLAVLEELPIGSALSNVFTVVDQDKHDNLTYSLTGNNSHYFVLKSGVLTIATPVDRDGPGGLLFLDQVTLTVTDTAGLQANTTLNITVVDINDNSPQFTHSIMHLNITENSADVKLTTMECSDLDFGQNAVFNMSILSGNTNNTFRLNGTDLMANGEQLDYEAMDTHLFTLHVIAVDSPDSGTPKTGSSLVIVEVLSENEYEPVWSLPAREPDGTFTNITIPDHLKAGSVVTRLEAVDKDAGDDGVIKYTLNAATKDDGTNISHVFSIDEDSGLLRITDSLKKDTSKNRITTFKLVVSASDGGASPRAINASLTIIAHVTNSPPRFNQTVYDVDVVEGISSGSVIHTLETEDDNGDNVTYTISGDSDGRFICDGNELKVVKEVDYEDVRHYVLSIKASDGIADTYAFFNIRVQDEFDEVAVITVFQNATIPEELPTGTVIVVFTVTDRDVGDQFEYALHGNGSNYIEVDSASGQMTIANRIDFDAGNIKVLTLQLVVKDKGGLEANASFNINVSDVNDNSPTCQFPVSKMNITENGTENTAIGSVNCSDIDGDSNASFMLNIVKGNEESVFKLLGSELNIDGTKVDYESMRDRDFSYTIDIEAIDYPVNGVSRTGTTVIIVQVLPANEFEPVWILPKNGINGTFPSQSVSENSKPGTTVTKFTARDDDMGPDGDVRYSMQSLVSDKGKEMSGFLFINERTGKVTTAGSLDRDILTGGTEFIDVVVVAKDNGSPSKSTEGRLRVLITNVNDNIPKFNQMLYDVTVTCDKKEKETLVNFDVTDADNSSSFSYSIRKGTSSLFRMENSVGAITLASIPAESDTVKQKAHILLVAASDGGLPEQTGEAYVIVQFTKCPLNNITTTTLPTTTAEAIYNCSNITVKECPSVLQMPLVENWALRSVCGLMTVCMTAMGLLLLRKSKTEQTSMFRQMSRPKVLKREELRPKTPVEESDDVCRLEPAWIKTELLGLPSSHVAPVDTRAGGMLPNLKLESIA